MMTVPVSRAGFEGLASVLSLAGARFAYRSCRGLVCLRSVGGSPHSRYQGRLSEARRCVSARLRAPIEAYRLAQASQRTTRQLDVSASARELLHFLAYVGTTAGTTPPFFCGKLTAALVVLLQSRLLSRSSRLSIPSCYTPGRYNGLWDPEILHQLCKRITPLFRPTLQHLGKARLASMGFDLHSQDAEYYPALFPSRTHSQYNYLIYQPMR
jgi:hypothetical protein